MIFEGKVQKTESLLLSKGISQDQTLLWTDRKIWENFGRHDTRWWLTYQSYCSIQHIDKFSCSSVLMVGWWCLLVQSESVALADHEVLMNSSCCYIDWEAKNESLISYKKEPVFSRHWPIPLCALFYGGDIMGEPWCCGGGSRLCCWSMREHTQKVFFSLTMTQ